MSVALTYGATEVIVNGAAVTRLRKAWISSTGLSFPGSSELRAYSTSVMKGLRGTDSSMFALDQRRNVKLVFEHMETTSASDNSKTNESHARRICYGMEWEPELACLSKEQLVAYCKSTIPDVQKPKDFYKDLILVLLYFILKTL